MALSTGQHVRAFNLTFSFFRALTRLQSARRLCSSYNPPEISPTSNENDGTSNNLLDDAQPDVDLSQGEFLAKLALKPNQPADAKFLKVAIVGNPNAGKSTLVNRLIKRKIAPVSTKIHTTRKNLFAVLTEGNTQIVLTDTPGLVREEIHKLREFEASLKVDPIKGSDAADVICVVIDASDRWDNKYLTPSIQNLLKDHCDKPSFLVLNKVDRVKYKPSLLDMVKNLSCGHIGGRPIPEYAPLKRENTRFSKPQIKQMIKKTQVLLKPVKKDTTEKTYVVGPLQQSCGDIWNEEDVKNEGNATLADESCDGRLDSSDKSTKQDSTVASPGSSTRSSVDEKKEFLKKLLRKSDKVSNKTKKVTAENSSGGSLEENKSHLSEGIDTSKKLSKTSSSDTLKTFDVSRKFNTETMTKIYNKDNVVYLKELSSGWPHFDEVFMISAEENDGVDGIKDFLIQSAKDKDWEYHSSLIANEMPYTLVENIVKEQILEIMPGPTPYLAKPVVQDLYFSEKHGMVVAVIQLKIKGSYYARLLRKLSDKIQKECSFALTNLFYDPVNCMITVIETVEDNAEKAPKRNVKKVFQYKKEVIPNSWVKE